MAQRVGATDERVRASFALGFPVRSVQDTSYLHGVAKPRLFVQGENDVFGDAVAIRALVEPLTDRPTLVVVPGSDHYFNGHLEPMQQALSAWMDGRPWA
jgi:alpha/beta superfamily hydrolase